MKITLLHNTPLDFNKTWIEADIFLMLTAFLNCIFINQPTRNIFPKLCLLNPNPQDHHIAQNWSSEETRKQIHV